MTLTNKLEDYKIEFKYRGIRGVIDEFIENLEISKIRKKKARDILKNQKIIGTIYESWFGDSKNYAITSKIARQYDGEDGLVAVVIETDREADKSEKSKDFIVVDLRTEQAYKIDSFYSLGSGDLVYGRSVSFDPISLKRSGDEILISYRVNYWNPSESISPKSEVKLERIKERK